MADHAVTGRDMRYVGSNLKHYGSSLMPKQVRKKFVRTLDPVDLPDL